MSHILHLDHDDKPEKGDPVIVDILRSNPDPEVESQLQRYVVPYRHRMSVFTIQREIYEHHDPTLAFRNQQCGRGICGVCRCWVEINGQKKKLVKGCTVPLKPGDHIVIYPSNEDKLIRDLVTTY